MCGIVGIWNPSFSTENKKIIRDMASNLYSRGPDSSGVWTNDSDGIAFGHRRLSIIDLSNSASQPMISRCGSYSLIFNGEIYNHKDLRNELSKTNPAVVWRSSSDTETLLYGLIYWGVENCLKKLIGMFSFGFWDNHKKKLFIARDRMGEKPLYYGHAGNVFIFASQLKSFKSHPLWQGFIDRDALNQFIRFSYVPCPMSIYKGIFKVPPACFLTISNKGQNISSPDYYWEINQLFGRNNSDKLSKDDAIHNLNYLLSDAVKKQMQADVPLGVFLSGGYDSTTIAALMQKHCTQNVKTFSIGFHENGFNEAKYAKKVAEYLGTDHAEFYVSSEEALSVIPRLPEIYDEPFSDISQIPTFLVSELAKRDVKVALSGDGGDELFCGYNRYISGFNAWRKLNKLPLTIRRIFSRLLNESTGYTIDRVQQYLPTKLQVSSLTDRLPKLAQVMCVNDGPSYYKSIVSSIQNPTSLVLNSNETQSTILAQNSKLGTFNFQEQMMLWDIMTYLPDDILTKVDRASMAVSLETRVPMLDHRIVEFALNLPFNLKLHKGEGKWLLRQVTHRYVPKHLMERPKMGFSVPMSKWLRGPLRDWAESLLDKSRLQNEGFFEPIQVRQKWNQHLSGVRNWQSHLWDILMFQAWLEKEMQS